MRAPRTVILIPGPVTTRTATAACFPTRNARWTGGDSMSVRVAMAWMRVCRPADPSQTAVEGARSFAKTVESLRRGR